VYSLMWYSYYAMSGPGRFPDAEDANLPVGTIRLMPMLLSLSNAEVSPNIVLRTKVFTEEKYLQSPRTTNDIESAFNSLFEVLHSVPQRAVLLALLGQTAPYSCLRAAFTIRAAPSALLEIDSAVADFFVCAPSFKSLRFAILWCALVVMLEDRRDIGASRAHAVP
jgi:hypothetical protein